MIYDLEDNPLTGYQFTMGSDKTINFKFRVDCVSGQTLSFETEENITVFGKQENQADYINLQGDSLDLSEWDGTIQTINCRFISEEVESFTRAPFRLIIR